MRSLLSMVTLGAPVPDLGRGSINPRALDPSATKFGVWSGRRFVIRVEHKVTDETIGVDAVRWSGHIGVRDHTLGSTCTQLRNVSGSQRGLPAIKPIAKHARSDGRTPFKPHVNALPVNVVCSVSWLHSLKSCSLRCPRTVRGFFRRTLGFAVPGYDLPGWDT